MNEKLASILTSLRVDKISELFLGGLGHILMSHRVIPTGTNIRLHNHKTLEITPNYLEEVILFYKKLSYDFLSLDQLYCKLGTKIETPFVIFTLDDGYKDNFEYAYPIFKKYNVPFAIFVTTSFPENSAIIWWYILEEYLTNNDEIIYYNKGVKSKLSIPTFASKETAFRFFRNIFCQKSENELMEFTIQTLQTSEEKIRLKNKELSLSWKEITDFSSDPLVTIGAHTINHVGLSYRNPDEVKFEMLESKQRLEKIIGKPVEHFCYPFGSKKEAGLREAEIAKELGFKTACTTRVGNIYKGNANLLTLLPRLSLNAAHSINLLKLWQSGLLPFIKNKGRLLDLK